MKSLIKAILRRAGYELRWITPTPDIEEPDVIAARTVKEPALYRQWVSPYPLYAPWAGSAAFMDVYEGVADATWVSPDRCYILQGFMEYALNLPGEVAECGVFRGGTALLLSRTIRQSGKRLHLFDSFRGLPAVTAGTDNFYKQGDFAQTTEAEVRTLLAEYSACIELHVGWIPETFLAMPKHAYCFVHVDVDLYQPALDCCDYFYDKLVEGGVMIFDDYGFPSCRGEKEAVDQFCANRRDKVITLPTGQGLLIKSGGGS